MIAESATGRHAVEEIARIVYEETAAALRHMPGGVWPRWDHLTPEQRAAWVRFGRGKELRHFPAALKTMVAVAG